MVPVAEGLDDAKLIPRSECEKGRKTQEDSQVASAQARKSYHEGGKGVKPFSREGRRYSIGVTARTTHGDEARRIPLRLHGSRQKLEGRAVLVDNEPSWRLRRHPVGSAALPSFREQTGHGVDELFRIQGLRQVA